jgi:hypothetical protein
MENGVWKLWMVGFENEIATLGWRMLVLRVWFWFALFGIAKMP